MAYPEKRKDTFTGRWWGEVDLRAKGGPRRKRSFKTLDEAQDYETYVRKHNGEEPPEWLEDGRKAPREGRSFREMAERAKAAGGWKGKWLAGRDKSGMRRLDWIIDRLGDYDIDDITLAVISERVIEDLERRPTRRGTRRGQGDINRFLAALSGVLTFALKRGLTTHKLALPFNNDYLKAERFPVRCYAEVQRSISRRSDHWGHRACDSVVDKSSIGQLVEGGTPHVVGDHRGPRRAHVRGPE
jgi:hypothetical protein